VSDADTLAISDADVSAPTRYYIDLISVDGAVTKLLASGVIGISNSLAP
jgi:hypothetical protein